MCCTQQVSSAGLLLRVLKPQKQQYVDGKYASMGLMMLTPAADLGSELHDPHVKGSKQKKKASKKEKVCQL